MTLLKLDSTFGREFGDTFGHLWSNHADMSAVFEQGFHFAFGNNASTNNSDTLSIDVECYGIKLHRATTLKKSAMDVANGPSFGLSGTM